MNNEEEPPKCLLDIPYHFFWLSCLIQSGSWENAYANATELVGEEEVRRALERGYGRKD